MQRLASRSCPRLTVSSSNPLPPPRTPRSWRVSMPLSLGYSDGSTLPPGTIRVHSIDTGILTAPISPEMPLNSDWNCTMALLTRARAASFSFLQLRRLRRCAPRPPPASPSKHPFLILTSPYSSSDVPTVNSLASSPLHPKPCDNSSSSSTSNSTLSCPMRPLYSQLDWPQEVPAQNVVADDGRGSRFS